MEEIEIEVELRDNTFLIDAEVDWHLMECECSSECGNQWVTETWNEVRIEEIYIRQVHYLTDSEEYKEIPINSLSKDDIMAVHEAIEEHVNEHQ